MPSVFVRRWVVKLNDCLETKNVLWLNQEYAVRWEATKDKITMDWKIQINRFLENMQDIVGLFENL